jgi:UDP-N-acetylglucosamine:LPS N-acetylglucosamine transferase
MGSEPLRVVFLSTPSGGGHHGTARAFAYWIELALRRPVEAQIIDVYSDGMQWLPWTARIRSHSYLFWWAYLRFTEFRWVLAAVTRPLRKKVVRTTLASMMGQPDLLVAVHYTGAHCLELIASALPVRPATLTIASDYAPHRAWFRNADLTVVSDPLGLARASRCAFPSERLMGVPLLPCLPIPAPSGPTGGLRRLRVLTVMGADGTNGGRVIALLRALEQHVCARRFSIDVVCGYNEALRASITELASQCTALQIQAHGFVDDMPQRFADADIGLLRASSLVVTEALSAATPLLVFEWHANEEPNLQLLKQWQCGFASRSPKKLLDWLSHWALFPGALAEARMNAKKLAEQSFDVATTQAILARLGLKPEPLPAANPSIVSSNIEKVKVSHAL